MGTLNATRQELRDSGHLMIAMSAHLTVVLR
jgi:hypothetical protein